MAFPAVYIYTVGHAESDFRVKIERSKRLNGQNSVFLTYNMFKILFFNLFFLFFVAFYSPFWQRWEGLAESLPPGDGRTGRTDLGVCAVPS